MGHQQIHAIVLIFHCCIFFQPLEVQACVTTTSSSARPTVSAYQTTGSVMATLTVRTHLMNTTPAHLSPAGLTISSVPTPFVSPWVGCVMATTTAGTWVMSRTAQLLHSVVHQDSGCALLTWSVLTWTKCVTVRETVPMELMSPLSAVSSKFDVFLITLKGYYFKIDE